MGCTEWLEKERLWEQDERVQRWGVQSGKDKIYGGTGNGGEGEPSGRVWAKIKQKSEEYKGGKADVEKESK